MENAIAAPQNLSANTTSAPSQVAPNQGVQSPQQGQILTSNPSTQNSSGGVFDVFSQPAIKKAMPAIIALLTIVVFLLIYSWSQVPPYRTVFPGLSESDRQAAFEALSSAEYSAKIDVQTGELKVPAGRYHEARLYLSSLGLPKSAALGGIESLGQDNAMTTSQFMEQVRYVSAVERELALSVSKISTIESARVHLASPKQSVFVRNRVPAKASVVVAPYPGRSVSDSQVQAIVHLVASSVPYLATEDVSVVDQRGQLLTNDNRFSSMQMNAEQSSHKERMEDTYRGRIEAFLTPVVGSGNVRSEVDVLIDFTEIESTFEEYDGNDNGPRARSEVLSVEQNSSAGAMGVPGVSSGEQGSQGLENGTLSSKSTRNYEMDRAVRHVKRQGGTVERISVAVVVNPPAATMVEDEDGVQTEVPGAYSEAELMRFTDLVKSVVGYDQERGDVVTIVSAKFEQPEPIAEYSDPWFENTFVTGLIKNISFALAFIVIVLFVIKPVLTSYTSSTTPNSAPSLAFPTSPAGADSDSKTNDGKTSSTPLTLSTGTGGITEDMLDTANTYDSKVALVRMLVSEDSGRVANVLKKMIRDA
ncbi:MAG: flagellar basal-body MS-ring/collar protein FliF [Porticoccaceae bacterium]|nr:flagellar basal-body MS-ring/collar protein FliF [Porticoccaceae bacterium]